jgi:hypothetical protein
MILRIELSALLAPYRARHGSKTKDQTFIYVTLTTQMQGVRLVGGGTLNAFIDKPSHSVRSTKRPPQRISRASIEVAPSLADTPYYALPLCPIGLQVPNPSEGPVSIHAPLRPKKSPMFPSQLSS